jgi:hypothetical protein
MYMYDGGYIAVDVYLRDVSESKTVHILSRFTGALCSV